LIRSGHGFPIPWNPAHEVQSTGLKSAGYSIDLARMVLVKYERKVAKEWDTKFKEMEAELKDILDKNETAITNAGNCLYNLMIRQLSLVNWTKFCLSCSW